MAESDSRLLAYLQLLRLPNVFTAAADAAMGFIFVRGADDLARGETRTVLEFSLLVAASCMLYLAGTALNDWFDLNVDRRERPERPLPSGRIAPATAATLGWMLLGGGVVAASAAAIVCDTLLPTYVAAALALNIVLYDGMLKHTPLGPAAMGGCRALGVLLGMSAAGGVWGTENYLTAAAVGVYIAGVTYYARHEVRGEAASGVRFRLLSAIAVMLSGIALLAQLPDFRPLLIPRARWQLFAVVLGLLIAWQCLRAVFDPRPQLVQTAVKQSLMSLVLLDAAVVLGVAGRGPALAVLALLIPAVVLGRWVYST
jgi:4-hydroxybenzoate polyprenyltransferase